MHLWKADFGREKRQVSNQSLENPRVIAQIPRYPNTFWQGVVGTFGGSKFQIPSQQLFWMSRECRWSSFFSVLLGKLWETIQLKAKRYQPLSYNSTIYRGQLLPGMQYLEWPLTEMPVHRHLQNSDLHYRESADGRNPVPPGMYKTL